MVLAAIDDVVCKEVPAIPSVNVALDAAVLVIAIEDKIVVVDVCCFYR